MVAGKAGTRRDGKQIFKNVLGKTQAEVKDKLAAALDRVKKLNIIVSDKMTVIEWCELWLETYGKPNMRPSTYETYEGNLRLHVKPGIGDLPLNKVTTLVLQKFFNGLLKDGRIERKESEHQPRGLSVKTVSNIRAMLYSVFEKAVAEHLMLTNPVAGCKLPKREKQEMKTMPVEGLAKFFEEAKASGKLEFYYLDFSTGLRRGELLGLKWEDVDFEHSTIAIKRQVIRVQGRIEEGPLKTKNAYRTIAVGEDVMGMLYDLKERMGGASPYLFPSPNGGPQDPDSVLPMFKRMLNRCGLETMRFHDIRHPNVKLSTKDFLPNFHLNYTSIRLSGYPEQVRDPHQPSEYQKASYAWIKTQHRRSGHLFFKKGEPYAIRSWSRNVVTCS